MTGFGTAPFGTSPFGTGLLEPPLPPTPPPPTPAAAPRPYRPFAPALDWAIHPRNADLSRSQDPISGWASLVLVERHNAPDTWTVTGPAAALSVFGPGMGCILDRNDQQITSGQVTGIARSSETVDGRRVETMTVEFASDLADLGDRLLLPAPGQAVTPGTVFTFPISHDARIASAEGLLLYYINYNMGPAARADRRLPRLRIPTSLDRGGTTTFSARLDTLGVAVRDIAEFGNLRVRIVHTEDSGGAWLDVEVTASADLSADVRFGTGDSAAAGILSTYDYRIGKPTVTRPLVGLGGEGAAREFLELRNGTAESLWARSSELFVDQRQIDPAQTDKVPEATRAGQEALAEGAGPTSVSFIPELGPDLVYRRDVRVGDIVGYDLPGLDPSEDKIRQATTMVAVESGQPTERVAVVVGTPDAALTLDQRRIAKALREIGMIKRSP